MDDGAPRLQPIEATCPKCEDVELEVVRTKAIPLMNGWKNVITNRCPRCGVEVIITTIIEVIEPVVPKTKIGLYIPRGVKLPEK